LEGFPVFNSHHLFRHRNIFYVLCADTSTGDIMEFCFKITPKCLSLLGQAISIIGVVMIFFWGPPQPTFEEGVSIGLSEGTFLESEGKTVGQLDQEKAAKKTSYEIMSRVGLGAVLLGFVLQFIATLLTPD
jgi:hypothetical protein